VAPVVAMGSWSSVYHKILTDKELLSAYESMNSLMFAKDRVPLFSQLLFSWNAIRPEKGHFTFSVQARDAHTGKWGNWHRMVDWGNGVQRSYASKSDGFSKYTHVRLEMEPFSLADSFRVKITGNKGAKIGSMRAFAITVANLREFKAEHVGKELDKLSSVHVQKVPKISQFALNHEDSSRICSPTSCTMITRFLTGDIIDPIDFAKHSYDKGLGTYGSWPFNMAHAFERCKGENYCFNTRLNSFVEIHQQLKRGYPVAVSVRGSIKGAPKPFPYGHLLVVVGWDSKMKKVICHDPSTSAHDQAEQHYDVKDFIRAWELSHRLAYWIEPNTEA
jgi:hypothetical protein